MDLSFTDEQEALRALARQIFEGHCTQERLREVEAREDRYDPLLWSELARANILGAGLPESVGGIGGGIIEACIVLEHAGRTTAPVPLWASLVGAMAAVRFGQDDLVRAFVAGGAPIVVALGQPGAEDPYDVRLDARWVDRGWRLSGPLGFTPAAARATGIVVAGHAPEGFGLFMIDPEHAVVERADQAGGEPLYRLVLDDAEALALADPPHADAVEWMVERAVLGVCAEQLGVAERALELTARFTSERRQFDKPLGAFQAVQQRAADAYIDVQAMRWTLWEAAWRHDQGLEAEEQVAVAKVWAAEGGERVLAATQHLHGGMGVDMDYPLHRYTFAARKLALRLGGAAVHLERLGEVIAR